MSLTFSPDVTSLTWGSGSTTATATATLNDGSSSTSISWSCSGTVSCSTSGNTATVTANGAGTGTVTAASTYGGVSASRTFTTALAVTSVSAISGTTTVYAGESTTLSATVNLSNGTTETDLTWSAGDPSQATVPASCSGQGSCTITGNYPNSTTITARSNRDSNKSSSVTLTIVGVSSVSVTPPDPSIKQAGTVVLSGVVNMTNGTTETGLTWTTSDSAKVSIDTTTGSSVTATGVALGSATITACSTRNTAKCGSVTVTVTTPVDSVSVSPTSATLNINWYCGYRCYWRYPSYGWTTLTGTVKYNDGRANDSSVTWSSADTTKVTVNSSGTVTAVACGRTTVTGTSTIDSGKSASSTIDVDVWTQYRSFWGYYYWNRTCDG